MALYGGVTLPGRPCLENVRRLDLLSIKPIQRMQRYGFNIDIPHFLQLSSELAVRIAEKHRLILSHIPADRLSSFIDASGTFDDSTDETDSGSGDGDFNPDSGPQMAELLFTTLGIGKGHKLKTTKGGSVAVDKEQLENLKSSHPIIQEVLDYRGLVKLKGTYVDKLPRLARLHPRSAGSAVCPVCGLGHRADTWRVHTQLMGTRTATGRFACAASWTPVVTKRRGIVKLADVRLGDLVWTHRGRWRPVVCTLMKGIDRMYHVRFSNGEVLTCTADHKLLVLSHGCEQSVDTRRNQSETSTGALQDTGISYDSGNSRDDGYQLSQCALGTAQFHARSGTEGSVGDSVPPFKDCREEPNVREDPRAASQLDWSGGRWVRVFDLLEGWEAAVCPPDSDGRSAGSVGFTGGVRCASYRREPQKQRSGQSGAGYKSWTSSDTSPAEGFSFCSIEEINFAGCFEVYDISVEEDESYLACGVFSHNSKLPNLQNLGARTEDGRSVRAGFIASPGTRLIANDFSQIELRMLAHISGDETMIDVYLNDGDIHTKTACGAFGITPEEVNKLVHRPPAKIANFSIAYGTTEIGFLAQLKMAFLRDMKKPVPAFITEDWVKGFITKWFEVYKRVRPFMDRQTYNAMRYGIVWTLAGRVRRIPEVRSVHRRIQQAGIRQAGNVKDQGSCADLMRLAMASVDDRLELLRQQGYWCWPLLTVHDELIVEAEEDVAEAVQMMMQEEMDRVAYDRQSGKNLLKVPIRSDGSIGTRWEK